ncbi:hypothetical protein [Cyclobacterium roseum]|uniref:hypothetical protein n=1 Tax=Cyclobacterium roseum TaxID=2666137 RepID=UPI00139097A8|nr:hypothetical protein [Cyclobacterium roseum]
MAALGAVAVMLVAGWQFGVSGTAAPFSATEVALEKAVEGSGSGQWVCFGTTYESFCTDMDGDACHNYKRVNDVYTCT